MLYFLGGDFDIVAFIAFIIIAVLAFAYHELGHAVAADRLGDPTPRMHGRMTLNPFPHLSLFGMVMLILIGFGWAVTPINPNRMRGNPRTSHAIVAIAGPLGNLLMAILFAIPLRLMFGGFLFSTPGVVTEFVQTLCVIGVRLNIFLIAFNLLPIPPLDGFWVLRGVLPPDLAYRLDGLQQYGTAIFLIVIFALPYVGLSIFPAMNGFTNQVFDLLVFGFSF